MRNVTGDGPVLPWLLIRQDGPGNRYRVGSYATRDEAQQTAARLGAAAASEGGPGGPGAGGYLVESRDHGSDARG
jgi:hypothetical protein